MRHRIAGHAGDLSRGSARTPPHSIGLALGTDGLVRFGTAHVAARGSASREDVTATPLHRGDRLAETAVASARRIPRSANVAVSEATESERVLFGIEVRIEIIPRRGRSVPKPANEPDLHDLRERDVAQ